MGSTPVCTISAEGIYRPPLVDVLNYFITKFQGIYGADVYLGSDSMDGEWVGLLAVAVDDCNAQAVAVYNSFSPATAQGAGLASNVKLNGLQKKVASYSTMAALCVGQQGVTITSGVVEDENGYAWDLPASVSIPPAGQIAVTLTCETIGAITAPAQMLTIKTPVPGWQSCTSSVAANPGAPVETDAQLRVRQSNSTMNSSSGLIQSIVGVVAALPGVTACLGFENDADTTNGLGIPGHSVAIVVAGGSLTDIATAIYNNKAGAGTYGTTSQTVLDANGLPVTVAFFVQSQVSISWSVTLTPGAAYTAAVGASIQAAIATWTSALAGGQSIQWNRAFAAAYLNGAASGGTYEITGLEVCRTGGTLAAADVPLNFWEQATCLPSNVAINV
jgi:uncharacterized phage protein gp47/JayE